MECCYINDSDCSQSTHISLPRDWKERKNIVKSRKRKRKKQKKIRSRQLKKGLATDTQKWTKKGSLTLQQVLHQHMSKVTFSWIWLAHSISFLQRICRPAQLAWSVHNDEHKLFRLNRFSEDKGFARINQILTLQSNANLLASMIAAFLSRSDSNANTKECPVFACQYTAWAAAFPPPLTPQTWVQDGNCLNNALADVTASNDD